MITNQQVVKYLREHVRGSWQKYFSVAELAEVHGLTNNLHGMIAEHFAINTARKELVSNVAGDKVVWLDGIQAGMLAMVYLSPAVPTCKEVHINITAEAAGVLDRLKTKVESDKYADWDSKLLVHTVSRADLDVLDRELPDNLDMVVVTVFSVTQNYLRVILSKLKVGGLIWIESSIMSGRVILEPNSEIARFNDWLAAQDNLEVSIGIDGIGYTLIRKIS